MEKKYIQLTIYILIFHHFDFTKGGDTTCSDSQKHFANLCFTPKPFLEVDWDWVKRDQPSDGWHLVLGNDITRLHFAEALRGELLLLTDNYEDVCMRSIIAPGPNSNVEGMFFGFGNLTSKWNCKNSVDFPGVLLCDEATNAPTKYHEYFNYYNIYTDNKNFSIGIVCFPNGQVGWITFSKSTSLTEEEKNIIKDRITSLGFPEDTTVTVYDESKCLN